MAHIWIIPLAFIGLAISFYIYSSKRNDQKLVCALGGSCNEVTGSKYSKTFGIPNEVGGMVYFLVVLVLAALSIFGVENHVYIPIHPVLIGISAIGALFAVYLLSLQAFVLKKWCEYCVTTAIITFLILAIELFLR